MSSSDPGSGPPDLSTLQENFSQQQAKINELKELVRQSDVGKNTASAQEKNKSIGQRLAGLKSKSARSRQAVKSISEVKDDANASVAIANTQLSDNAEHDDVVTVAQPAVAFIKSRSETPGSEKIQLLRKQMEFSRLKMAEHENRKLDVKEKLTQLKVNLDSSQKNLEKSHLGRSIGDLSILTPAPHKDKYQSASDLTRNATVASLDKDRIRYLEKKVRELEIDMKNRENDFLNRDPESEHLKTIKNLENQILDYQENLKEKECVIEARTQAVSLVSENMSMKGKNTVDLLEDTKQEMFKMQQRFVEAEEQYKHEIDALNAELEHRNFKVSNLEEVNDILETTRYDLTIKNSALAGQANDAHDYSTKINELNMLNKSLQKRIANLENENPAVAAIDESSLAIVQEMRLTVEKLEVENDDLKKLLQNNQQPATDIDLRDKIRLLEAKIQEQQEIIDSQLFNAEQLENNLHEKTIEYNVLSANFSVLQEKLKSSAPKSLFSMSTDEEAEAEIAKLKAQLDDANKSMIKNKLKTKQLQKQVDSVKKMSDVNQQVIALTEQNCQLQQKIAELEASRSPFLASTGGSASETDLEQRLHVLETTCQNQISAIQLLEEQKIDISENLYTTKHELVSLIDNLKVVDDKDETARVQSHMDSIAQEEKLEDYSLLIAALRSDVERLTDDNERLTNEKTVLNEKLDSFITENFELLDKLDKLSKGSSAESIEIVENLTPQEKIEMEEFQQSLLHKDEDNGTMSKDLSESLVKLREESSELMHKIEMFTNERREVLDKMEVLTADNAKLVQNIAELSTDKQQLELSYETLVGEQTQLKVALADIQTERNELVDSVKQLNANRAELKDEINKLLVQLSTVADSKSEVFVASPMDFAKEPYVKSLKSMETQMENYRKAKEKNLKNEAAKKLTKEAKNVHELMSALLVDHEKCVEQLNALRNECDQVRSCESAASKTYYTDLETQLGNFKSEITKVQQHADERALEIERLTEELEAQTNTMQTNENQTAQTIETLRNDNERLKNEIMQLAGTVHTKDNQIDSVAKELANFKQESGTRIETYKKEIDILKVLVAEQKSQLIETITEHQNEIDEKTKLIETLERQVETATNQSFASREQYVLELNEKMVSLKQLFDDNNDLLEQQAIECKNKQETIDLLNAQIMDLYKNMESSSTQLIEKEDEINYLQEIIDSNRTEIKQLAVKCHQSENVIAQLTAAAEEKVREMIALQTKSMCSNDDQDKKVANLSDQVNVLENKNKEQLEKLKKFAANLKKKNAQCTELENRCKQLVTAMPSTEAHTAQLGEMQMLLSDRDEQLRAIHHENSRISVSLQQSSSSIAERDSLQASVLALEDEVKQLTELNMDLRSQINQLAERLDNATKQVEYNECDVANRRAELENLTSRLNEKVQAMDQLNHDLEQRNEDVHSKNVKLVKCKTIIKEKNKEMKRLQDELNVATEKLQSLATSGSSSVDVETKGSASAAEIVRLQHDLDQIMVQHAELKSTHDQDQKTIAKLKKDYGELCAEYSELHATSADEIYNLQIMNDDNSAYEAMELKMEENDHFIETLLLENRQLKEKISKLEEGIGHIEERRSSLERQAILLGTQLHDKTEELVQSEYELQDRLNVLSSQDVVIEQKLKEAAAEKQELQETLMEINDAKSELSQRVGLLENQLDDVQEQLQQQEEENNTINRQNHNLQLELTRETAEFQRKIAESRAEVDVLETDLSAQLEKIENERRRLHEELEKCSDDNAELHCDIVRFKEIITSLEQSNSDLEREMTWVKLQNESMAQDQVEVQELRMQIVHDQTEIENLKSQNQTVQQNHDVEVSALKQQLAELDSLRTQIGQNQTDDQMFIQNENERLQTLLASREEEIQNYQRQNLQLQMFAGGNSGTVAVADPFSILTDAATNNAEKLNEKISVLELQLQQTTDDLTAAQSQLVDTRSELQSKLYAIHELECAQKELKAHVNELHLRCQEIQNECLAKDTELADARSELSEKLAAIEVIDIPAMQNVHITELSVVQPPPPSSPPAPITASATEQKCEELQRNIYSLEQYISDIQIQLRISTNDCEQLSQTVQSLEEEIHTRSKAHAEQISSLKAEQALSIHPIPSPPICIPEPVIVPSFNSSMFFEPTAVTSAFDIVVPQPVAVVPEAQPTSLPEPVVEEIIVPKKAYLCGPEQAAAIERKIDEQYVEEIQNQLKASTNDCEQLTQTVQLLEVEIRDKGDFYEEKIKQLRIELNRAQEQNCRQAVNPVLTEAVPSTTVFFSAATTSAIDTVFAMPTETKPEVAELEIMHDEGWGFGSDEAALEEQHQQNYVPILRSRPSDAESRLREADDKIDELSLETERLRSENIALQVKSGKMLKKLKEYKSRNDELSVFKKSPSVESNELDLAIQEELNSQIKALESRIKELKADQEKDNIERQSLLKRVDVLTAANDRMTEMKERQDAEMETCKNKCRQLMKQLEQLEEWGDDNYNSKTSSNDAPLPSDDATAQHISSLNQQITDLRLDSEDVQTLLDEEKQHSALLEDRIKKLQESMLVKSSLEEEHQQSVHKMSALIDTLNSDIVQKTETIVELEARIDQLTAQMNDSVATIDALSEESNNIKTYLDQLKTDHASKIDENNNLSKELRQLSDKNVELADEVNRLKSSDLFGVVRSESDYAELESRVQDLTATMQYKDAQIMHLNQKVDDAIQEDQTPQLIQEILGKNVEINALRTQVRSLENDKCELENNLSLQLTKEMAAAPTVADSATNHRVEELERDFKEMQSEKEHMEHELQVLNDKVLSTLDVEDKLNATYVEINSKNMEISDLKDSLSQLQQQQTTGNLEVSSNNDEHLHKIEQLEAQMQSLNDQWGQVLDQRCAELAESWRQHLAQREAEFEAAQTAIQQAMQAQNDVANTVITTQQPSDPNVSYDGALVIKMQEALESQEMEIVTLKEQLAIRSAEYARIAAQVDPFGQMATMSSMTSMDYRTKNSTESLESNAGKKSELDLALYMLHQRDMRCEELTEELISLLEERDTLQLKLSNSIRQIEDFKGKSVDTEAPSEADSTDTSPEKSTGARVSSGDLSPDSANLDFSRLNDKISQLQKGGNSRDKTLRAERDQRRLQMTILQRDVATLPPEAVAELIGGDYTMSRSSAAQSQPSQLLSWLWGKSTPKAADEN